MCEVPPARSVVRDASQSVQRQVPFRENRMQRLSLVVTETLRSLLARDSLVVEVPLSSCGDGVFEKYLSGSLTGAGSAGLEGRACPVP